MPPCFPSLSSRPSDERRAIWLELDDFQKGKTEKDIPSFSFNSWQSHRAKWYAPCNGPVWSNENPTRLTSAPSEPHWSITSRIPVVGMWTKGTKEALVMHDTSVSKQHNELRVFDTAAYRLSVSDVGVAKGNSVMSVRNRTKILKEYQREYRS